LRSSVECSISSGVLQTSSQSGGGTREGCGLLKGKAATIGGSAAERPLLHALSANGIVNQSFAQAATNNHSSNNHCPYTRSTSHTQPWPPSDPQQGVSSLQRFSTPDPLSTRRSAASPPQSTIPQPSHHQNLDLPPNFPTVSMPAPHLATLSAAKQTSPFLQRKRSSSRPSKSAPKVARDHTPVCQSG
jgi:hypothetical protein